MSEETTDEEMAIRAVIDRKYFDETPTISIYVAILSSTKLISKVVKILNNILPVPSLQHLKRVKRQEGKTLVILDIVSNEEENEIVTPQPKKIKLEDQIYYLKTLERKGVNCKELGIIGVEICDVPEFGPKTKEQYKKTKELWPVNFHPEKKLETMLSKNIFEDSEYKYHLENMKHVIKLGASRKNVALVADMKTGRFIAMGYDRLSNHPLQHAIMVAIDAVARTQNGGAWNLPFSELTLPTFEKKSFTSITCSGHDEINSGPYLCTGYDIYVVREPCVMCAMSLVHSRIKRVFFHERNPEKGALVSKCQIHTIRDLNHHYEAFEVLKVSEKEKKQL